MGTEPTSQTDNQHNDIVQWACKQLSSRGYTLKSNTPEKVQNTPWSYVIRFETSNGYIYLKHTPELIALEARIIQILHDHNMRTVLVIIAQNTKLNCFLMKDAGRTLRSILKQQFDAALLCKAIDQFTSLQIAAADHVDVFINIGVPDWRLNKIPSLYKEVISQKDFLIADGLSAMDVGELERLFPKVANLCQKLSGYSIKQTIVQPDFNDNNKLIDDKSQDITIIDLGEIVISHPFFSLINCLHVIKKHHELTDKDESYLKIKDSCLKNYMSFESKENVQDAFATAQLVWFVYTLLAHHRLMQACGVDKLMAFQHGKLKSSLKKFMTACAAVVEH